MIRLQAHLFENLQDRSHLLAALQTALQLEHATLPPYLVATYSLKDENAGIAELILDVTYEEMLHMTLVCNLINALGGSPSLNGPDFIPKYPGPLPGAVPDLIVPLARFDKNLLENVFMKIEAPEKPQDFPVIAAAESKPARTIGQFYGLIKEIIREGGDALFANGDPTRQVIRRIDDDRSTAVTNAATALAAIDLIVEQGEGTNESPLEAATGEPAHYYRFAEILHGRALQADSSRPEGFSYSGAPINFDEAAVYPVKENLHVAEIPADSMARPIAEEFNRQYTRMLSHLHRGFNGELGQINLAVNIMSNDLTSLARQLVQIEIEPGLNAGPTFEFAPLD